MKSKDDIYNFAKSTRTDAVMIPVTFRNKCIQLLTLSDLG